MTRINLLFLFIVILGIVSCVPKDSEVGNQEGYAPIYIAKNLAYTITIESPQKVAIPGKMYLFGDMIYLVDIGRGVHIIDNTNPANPVKLKFMTIPGVHDAVVKSGILYADNISDLVAYDIKDVNNIIFKKRVKNIYSMSTQLYPEFASGYFECVDTTKGYVVGWKKVTLSNPKCFR